MLVIFFIRFALLSYFFVTSYRFIAAKVLNIGLGTFRKTSESLAPATKQGFFYFQQSIVINNPKK